MPGVLAIITPDNALRLATGGGSPQTVRALLLQERTIRYNGQHIAVVVAQTLEQAEAAAGQVQARYHREEPVTSMDAVLGQAYTPKNFRNGARAPDPRRGNPEAAFDNAPVKLDVTYTSRLSTIIRWSHTRRLRTGMAIGSRCRRQPRVFPVHNGRWPHGLASGNFALESEEAERYSMHAFGAEFAEVRIDVDLGEIRVSRFVGAFDAGRVMNAKTARSQLIGGIVFGLGMALLEETQLDGETGRIVNANIAEYLVPVNADVPDIQTIIVGNDELTSNPLGAKGIGELPIVGVAAAVANAVYHASGVRVRKLPIRVEDVVM
jgi:CO/xanthine dehydrogenase Mo-binding subunit